jgi:hypothetical protein
MQMQRMPKRWTSRAQKPTLVARLHAELACCNHIEHPDRLNATATTISPPTGQNHSFLLSDEQHIWGIGPAEWQVISMTQHLLQQSQAAFR